MCQLKKKRLSKALGRKCARLNGRQEETKTIQQGVVQLILKLALISKHSQLETKRGSIGSKLRLKQPRKLSNAPTRVGKEILIKRSKAQPTSSRQL